MFENFRKNLKNSDIHYVIHLDFRDDNTDKTIINLTKSNLASYANVYEIPALCSMTKIAEKSIRVRLRMKSHKTELR